MNPLNTGELELHEKGKGISNKYYNIKIGFI